MSLSVFYYRAQIWTWLRSTDGLTGVEQRGKIMFLDLLVTLPNVAQEAVGCLPQGHTAGSCSTQCSPEPPGPFLHSCLLGSWSLACTGEWGYSFLASEVFSTSLNNTGQLL